MQSQRTNIDSKSGLPVGRIVMGSLYKPNTTDAEGKPLVVKTGPNAGQARSNFFFALAIPKGTERHWAETAWGSIIWRVGHTAFPQAAQSPSFAWKVEDGDSQVPNKKGRKPCENEGWSGHWILKFSGGFAPKVYRPENGGYVQVTEVDYVKPGYFVEVAGTVDGNGSQSQPGVYLNHSMVCFRGYGPEINFGPSPEEAGFGSAPLPAGASMTPPASAIPIPAAAASAPAIPAMPVPATAAAVPAISAPAVPAAIPVIPNPGFLQVPGNASAAAPAPAAIPASPVASVAVPTLVPPAPVSPSSRMTAKAAGVTYEAMKAAGWDDANLIAHGYMNA